MSQSKSKYFSEEDVALAEDLAKLEILNEFCDKSIQTSFEEVGSSIDKNNVKISKPKFQEGRMRLKQITKLTVEISSNLKHLNEVSKRKAEKVKFVTPFDIEKKQKRWKDFTNFARRSLFSLKREINLMSRKIGCSSLHLLPDLVLRRLSSLCRSCLHLLKGLANFSYELQCGHPEAGALLSHSQFCAHKLLFLLPINNHTQSSAKLDSRDGCGGASSSVSSTSSLEWSAVSPTAVTAVLNHTAVAARMRSLASRTFTRPARTARGEAGMVVVVQDSLSSKLNHVTPPHHFTHGTVSGQTIGCDTYAIKKKSEERIVRRFESAGSRVNNGRSFSGENAVVASEEVAVLMCPQTGPNGKLAQADYDEATSKLSNIHYKFKLLNRKKYVPLRICASDVAAFLCKGPKTVNGTCGVLIDSNEENCDRCDLRAAIREADDALEKLIKDESLENNMRLLNADSKEEEYEVDFQKDARRCIDSEEKHFENDYDFKDNNEDLEEDEEEIRKQRRRRMLWQKLVKESVGWGCP